MSTAIEVLEFSRDLIRSGWTRGAWAEDSAEQSVDPEDVGACAFCLEGALKRARHVLKPDIRSFCEAKMAVRAEMPTDYFSSLITFNDAQHSEEPVVDLIDRAIESLKEPA